MSACGVTPSGDTGPANAPEGRKLLRLEVRNAQTPIERKPEWIARRRRWGPSTRPCSRS
jgi:lipoic acid synthetase